jgi:hypothetical protein
VGSELALHPIHKSELPAASKLTGSFYCAEPTANLIVIGLIDVGEASHRLDKIHFVVGRVLIRTLLQPDLLTLLRRISFARFADQWTTTERIEGGNDTQKCRVFTEWFQTERQFLIGTLRQID